MVRHINGLRLTRPPMARRSSMRVNPWRTTVDGSTSRCSALRVLEIAACNLRMLAAVRLTLSCPSLVNNLLNSLEQSADHCCPRQ